MANTNDSDPRPQLPLVAEIPHGYEPRFTPAAVAFGTAEVDGQPAVSMQIATYSGVQILFFPPEVMRQIAGNADACAHAADRGIISPRGALGPDGKIPKHYTMNAEPGHIPLGGSPIHPSRGNGKRRS